MATIRGLDHVAFGAGDVGAARGAFERLGFRTTPRGACAWPLPEETFRAESASVVFADTYLDVIAIDDARWPPAAARGTAGRGGLAPTGLVLGVAALDPALETLRARGVPHGDPYEIRRAIEGAESMHYRVARLAPDERRVPPVLVIEDRTPLALRAPDRLEHPNGARALVRATLAVPDLDPLLRVVNALFPPGAAVADAKGVRVASGTAELRAVLAPEGGRPRLASLRLACDDLSRARRLLAAAAVPSDEPAPGVVRVPAPQACGCALELVRA